MYCAACGTPLAPGLSYCNRCGMSLKEPSEPRANPIGAYLISAITVLGIAGLGLMLGGAMALRIGGQFQADFVGIYMLMTFSLVALIEFFLCRQLSRLLRRSEESQPLALSQQASAPAELRGPQPRTLPEPVPSVTENTTRTLEYSRNEPSR
ncbi:MAG: hypothetical protein ABJC10_02460 [Acidobacteriota bacterium]